MTVKLIYGYKIDTIKFNDYLKRKFSDEMLNGLRNIVQQGYEHFSKVFISDKISNEVPVYLYTNTIISDINDAIFLPDKFKLLFNNFHPYSCIVLGIQLYQFELFDINVQLDMEKYKFLSRYKNHINFIVNAFKDIPDLIISDLKLHVMYS